MIRGSILGFLVRTNYSRLSREDTNELNNRTCLQAYFFKYIRGSKGFFTTLQLGPSVLGANEKEK
ncbi:MAG: hypothetical protein ACJAXY_002497 [Nonlabens sp.]|jgi:hypothetical protein